MYLNVCHSAPFASVYTAIFAADLSGVQWNIYHGFVQLTCVGEKLSDFVVSLKHKYKHDQINANYVRKTLKTICLKSTVDKPERAS